MVNCLFASWVTDLYITLSLNLILDLVCNNVDMYTCVTLEFLNFDLMLNLILFSVESVI